MDQVRFNNIFATTEVDFSPIKTKTLQLKVGRCNNGYFGERQIYQQICQDNYDLCRVKVPAEDEFASLRLHQMGVNLLFQW